MDSGAAPEPPANVPPQSHSPQRAEATPRQRPRSATRIWWRATCLCSSDYRDIVETLKGWGALRSCITAQ